MQFNFVIRSENFVWQGGWLRRTGFVWTIVQSFIRTWSNKFAQMFSMMRPQVTDTMTVVRFTIM